MFDLLVRINPDAKLPMLQFFGKTNLNFLKYRHIAAGISVVLVLGGVVHMVVRGKNSFGVDFTGGSAMTFQYSAERKEIKDLREALTKAGVGENIIQYRKDLSSGKELLEVTAGMKESDKIIAAVEAFDGYKSINKREIGEQVGREMISNGLTALLLSFLGIIIYVSVRFEFSFAIGAIVALLHDVLVAVGLYVLFDRPIGLITIAALLTIIGYSVNDTIVIFDRIREDSKLKRNIPFLEVCNIALNETPQPHHHHLPHRLVHGRGSGDLRRRGHLRLRPHHAARCDCWDVLHHLHRDARDALFPQGTAQHERFQADGVLSTGHA
jgi:preprotein translocase SecF subunit